MRQITQKLIYIRYNTNYNATNMTRFKTNQPNNVDHWTCCITMPGHFPLAIGPACSVYMPVHSSVDLDLH